MRLSASLAVAKRRKDRKLGISRSKKKHKKLDAICEKVYNRNRCGATAESSEFNVQINSVSAESEVRRSTRARRAPVILDASPLPPKKRPRINKSNETGSVGRPRTDNRVKNESPCSTSKHFVEQTDGWLSRLRSRAKIVSLKEDYSPRRKRKLFEDLDGVKEDLELEVQLLDDEKDELEGGKSTVVKSKRPGRINASNVSKSEHLEIELDSVSDRDAKDEVEVLEEMGKDSLILKGDVVCKDIDEVIDSRATTEQLGQKEIEERASLELKHCVDNDKTTCIEPDKQLEQLGHADGGKQTDTVLVGRIQSSQLNDEECHGEYLEIKGSKLEDKMISASTDARNKPRIKEGRRCGLCGGGTDGKPPKKLVHDGAGSENETYSGSSSSEEPSYDIWDGFGDEPGWLGRLLGPINDRFGIAGIWVHQHCAVWSPEVYFAGLGCLKNVRAALCRGRVLKCTRCGRPGATIGCRVDRCPRTYHLPCARANGCIFDHRKFLIACTDHRHLFQPNGSQFLHRLKRIKAKKIKMEMRKLSNDAWRRDQDAEEKWLENCGEDEEFLKRESKRLHRDLLRIAPIYIGGSNCDSKIPFQGWESVAGLQDVIQCLKEVVILPLLYPELFSNLGLTPPRGVLLHGYPGTGKTLVVRALIGSCARGDKKIAYFARKGADCLGKYVGDAERQLRLLFQVAEKSQPSIIFFDEIDGLAPSRTRQQDQTHNSVVSTLLALMDGLKSRGSVVVIGATNRPDAVDSALRRPGRFDREIYFPLPSSKDREAILSLHTRKWPKPIAGSLLKRVARRTAGFAGADLQALCTQAAITALKRSCPWQELLSTAGKASSCGKRPSLPSFTVEERDWLEALSSAPPPCSRRESGMAANDVVSSPLQAHLVPYLLQPLCIFLVSLYLDEQLWLPPLLSKAGKLIENVVVSALERKKVQSDCWWSHVPDLLQETDISSEIASNLSRASILVGDAAEFSHSISLNDDADYGILRFEPCRMQHIVTHNGLLQNVSYASGKKTGFRILVSGNPRSGQKHLASCLLHCFVGNVEIRKIDLATISQEGHGDVIQGITQILMRCSSVPSCIIFMPRIDLWAIESFYNGIKKSVSPSVNLELSEESKSSLSNGEVDEENKLGPQDCKLMERREDTSHKVSFLWSSFIEQVESIGVSTSLMIMATSEVPFPVLPRKIMQFFGSETNCSLSTVLKNTVPRFSLHFDGNFDRDMVMKSSATKLSKDLAQQFIQLIHHRTHIYSTSNKEYKPFDNIDDDAATIVRSVDPDSAVEHGNKFQCSVGPTTRISLPPNKLNVKGRSSLLLAISTFGYQILCYPHFAELCWITSKLKEGPCVDFNGPWKSWPFNSCIVRPNNLSEKVDAACSSSNVKSTERSGLVRGLVAVGLSAYRGAYTSLREVSSEVRNVLELLVERINGKIQAGKDKYQFFRILSQVAYLEDMVYNWAYTLQSLEIDALRTDDHTKQPGMGSLDYNTSKTNVIQSDEKPNFPDEKLDGSDENTNQPGMGSLDYNAFKDNIIQSEEELDGSEVPVEVPLDGSDENTKQAGMGSLDIYTRVSDIVPSDEKMDGSEVPEEVPYEYSTKCVHCVDTTGEGGFRYPISEQRVTATEENRSRQMVLDDADPVSVQSADGTFSDPLGAKSLKQNGVSSEPYRSEDSVNPSKVRGDLRSPEHINGFSDTGSTFLPKNVFCVPADLSRANSSTAKEGCNKDDDFLFEESNIPSDNGTSNFAEHNVDINAFSEKSTALPTDYAGVTCLYDCCSECLYNLHHLIQKILIDRWKTKSSDWTIEDVHDVVALLSLDLKATITKFCLSQGRSDSSEGILDHVNYGKKIDLSTCKNSRGGLIMPMECSCHSKCEKVTEKTNMSQNLHHGLHLKSFYRDGVLTSLDPDEEVSFHCTFKMLCLHSLIECVEMIMQPLD